MKLLFSCQCIQSGKFSKKSTHDKIKRADELEMNYRRQIYPGAVVMSCLTSGLLVNKIQDNRR